jgi:hypothetical protein
MLVATALLGVAAPASELTRRHTSRRSGTGHRRRARFIVRLLCGYQARRQMAANLPSSAASVTCALPFALSIHQGRPELRDSRKNSLRDLG